MTLADTYQARRGWLGAWRSRGEILEAVPHPDARPGRRVNEVTVTWTIVAEQLTIEALDRRH